MKIIADTGGTVIVLDDQPEGELVAPDTRRRGVVNRSGL
jgi:hypothetical protein